MKLLYLISYNKINWCELSLKSAIFTYDYETIKKSREEIMIKLF